MTWLGLAVFALDGTGLRGAGRMDAAVLLGGHVRGTNPQGLQAAPRQKLGAVLGDLMRAHASYQGEGGAGTGRGTVVQAGRPPAASTVEARCTGGRAVGEWGHRRCPAMTTGQRPKRLS